MAEKKQRNTYPITPEEFVEVWESSENIQEVCKKTGMPRGIVLARASNYRKMRKDGTPGVNLKKMPRSNPRKLNINKLNKIVAGQKEEEVAVP